jgi:hypothetical protein
MGRIVLYKMRDFIEIQIVGSTKIGAYLVQLLNRVRWKAIFRQSSLHLCISKVPELLKKALYAEQLNITVVS